MVIDMFGLTEAEVLTNFPLVYQRLIERVKPERDQNRDAILRNNWWLHRRARTDLRDALRGTERYIATVETSKHRLFQFLGIDILPDNKLIVFTLDDAYFLGVLSSHIHLVWATGTGSTLEDRPVYVKTKGFDPFPFPAATPAQQARIRELAEQLDAHRKRQQAQHPTLTLTDLYNVVEKLRANQPLSPKDQQVNQQGLASVVLSLHQQLDAAVADAYNWPATLPEADILQRLVRLNHERAREEQQGQIRYLRPAYQAPGQQQAALALPTQAAATTATPATTTLQPWPTELAPQLQALRDALQQAVQPLSAAQIATRFKRLKPEKAQPLLDTLVALSLIRQTEEGYAA
jgi:hypothetical protein